MIPEFFRPAEDIKAIRALGDRSRGFRVELVSVFLGPFGVVFLMTLHVSFRCFYSTG